MTGWTKRCNEKRSLHRSGESCVPHESEDWDSVLLREGLPTQCGYMDCFRRVPSTARFNLRPPHHTLWCGRTLYGSWKYPTTRYDESGEDRKTLDIAVSFFWLRRFPGRLTEKSWILSTSWHNNAEVHCLKFWSQPGLRAECAPPSRRSLAMGYSNRYPGG